MFLLITGLPLNKILNKDRKKNNEKPNKTVKLKILSPPKKRYFSKIIETQKKIIYQ